MKEAISILSQYKGFDEQAFLQLCEDTDFETAFQILQRFNDNLKQSASSLKVSLSSEDADAAWKVCHKLAGSSELLGFIKFGKFARDLSHQIKASPDINSFTGELESMVLEIEGLIQLIDGCDIKLSATAF